MNGNIADLEQLFLEKELVSTKEIKELGFDNSGIQKLLESSVLSKVKRGCYAWNGVQKKEKDFSALVEEFFDIYTHSDDSQLVTEKLRELYHVAKTRQEKADVNYYLLLANYVYDLPRDLFDVFSKLQYKDCLVSEDRTDYSDCKKENQIRKKAYFRQFNRVYRSAVGVEKDCCLPALKKNYISCCQRKNRERQLIYDRNIAKLLTNLREDAARGRLRQSEINLLTLTEKVAFLCLGGKLRVKDCTSTEVMDQISCNNFPGALRCMEEYGRLYSTDYTSSLLYQLLEVICDKKVGERSLGVPSSGISFDSIIDAIYEDDFAEATQYLESIGRKDYGDLFQSLEKLVQNGYLNHDDIVLAFLRLRRGVFPIDLKVFSEKTEQMIECRDTQGARLYLEVLQNASSLTSDPELRTLFKHILESDEKPSFLLESSSSVPSKRPMEKQCILEETFLDGEKVERKEGKKENVSGKAFPSLELQLQEKISQLSDKCGLVLLPAMSVEEREQVYQFVREYPGVVAFDVDDFGDTRVCLRSVYPEYTRLDISSVINSAKESRIKKQYYDAYMEYLKILKTRNPRTSIYADIGFCFMGLGRREEAIDYFVVANSLSHERGEKKDYTGIIEQMRENLKSRRMNSSFRGDTEEEIKPNFSMKEEEFDHHDQLSSNPLEINEEFFEDLAALIREEGYSFDDAILQMGFSEEKIAYARLVYARDCYYLEQYKLGDKYLKKAANSSVKSRELRLMIQEVQKNKKFYHNRLDEEGKCLVLKSKLN